MPVFKHLYGWQGVTASVCQILDISQRRNLSYLRPKLGYLKYAVRKWAFENVRNKNGCVLSSTGKVDLSFGFNDTV